MFHDTLGAVTNEIRGPRRARFTVWFTNEKSLNRGAVRADTTGVSSSFVHDPEVRVLPEHVVPVEPLSAVPLKGRLHSRPPGFDRTARDVLEHLRRTSTIAQWMVVRFDAGAMRIVHSIGDSFTIPASWELQRADISGKLSVRVVRIRESSQLRSRFGFRSCVAAVIANATTGTSAPYGAIIGLDTSEDVETSGELLDQLRLHSRHLSSALAQHHAAFAREHTALCRVDLVNGFDTPETWVERVHVLDRHCWAIAELAAVAVVRLECRPALIRRFGHVGAEEFRREISYALRAVSTPDAFFGVIDDDHLAVVRLESPGLNGEDWERDLRLSVGGTADGAASNGLVGVGVAMRLAGERRGVEQALMQARGLVDQP